MGTLADGLGCSPRDDESSHPPSHSPGTSRAVFAVCSELVGGKPPRHSSALPPPAPQEAAPKGISGRTSYLRVRLAFHPYPQVIQLLCNAGRFGPPVRITGPSACPWVAHPVSGLLRATGALFRLAFAPAPRLATLNLATHSNSPAHSSIGTPSQDNPAPTACGRAVSGSLSLPSRGAFHRSLTVLVH